MSEAILQEMLNLSHELGRPENDLAILGEGNTSARIDDQTFYVKASGSELRTLRKDQVVRVRHDVCQELFNSPAISDEQIKEGLTRAVADRGITLRPSIETLMHAMLLRLDGIHFIGHTHPTAINAITCSDGFERLLDRRLFPDQVVICGPSAALVPYVDPGLPLATAVLAAAKSYERQYGEPPKTIYLKNHGFIALGKSAAQVVQISAMAVKSARILLGSLQAGEPVFMSDADVARISGRDDEHYRQRMLNNQPT